MKNTRKNILHTGLVYNFVEEMNLDFILSTCSRRGRKPVLVRMKEDHMLNGQLKPAYNIQFASSGAFIVGVMGSLKCPLLSRHGF